MDIKDTVIKGLTDKLSYLQEEMYAAMRDVHQGASSRAQNEIIRLREELEREKERSVRKDQIISQLGGLEQKIGAAVEANLQLQAQLNEANSKIAAYEERKKLRTKAKTGTDKPE